MTKIVFFADNDVTSDAKAVNAAMVQENADAYCFVGDGPYSTSGTGWVSQMKQHFDDKKDKMIWSRGNHDEDESESKQTQQDMEAWFPEAKSLGISDTWLISKQVGNVYIISMDSQDMDVEFKRDQYNWVAAELQKAKQLRASGQIDWIVALFHKPAFTLKSSHSPYTAVRFLYKDIFADAQLDFWVHGHNHNTQLWKPMVPDQTQANGTGKQLFTQLPDGTIDFSKEHGWVGIVTGHAGHEWNAIDDSGAGVQNVFHYRDSGKFGYTVLETNGKTAKVLSKDTDNKTTFEYPKITREGTIVEPDCSDPQKCKDPQTGMCRAIGANEHKSPTDGTCQKNPDPDCPPGQHKDPNGNCVPDTIPGETVCPRDYHFDASLQKCIPDLEPQANPVCPPGTTWDGNVCKPDGTGPPPGCPPGQCKDPVTNQCRPPGINETIDANGFCKPIQPTGCPDGQCKDPTTQQCRAIAADEEKDANGFCKKKPPEPTGDVLQFEEKGQVVSYKLTGKKVVMEKGTDHENGQRFNNEHQLENYVMLGEFKTGKGQEKIEMKTDGPCHGCSGNPAKLPIGMWYEPGLDLATGSVDWQAEYPHPTNHDLDKSKLEFEGKTEGNLVETWIKYAVMAYTNAQGQRVIKQFANADPNAIPIMNLHAIEKGQFFPSQYVPRNIKEVIEKSPIKALESEIRMHQGTNHDTAFRNCYVYEIVPPN